MNKFIVSSSALLRQLAKIASLAKPGAIVPILETVRLVVDGGILTLTTSDIQTTLTATVRVEARESLAVCVPAKRLMDTLKGLPDQPVTFTLDTAPKANISADNYTLILKSANGTYKLAGENPSGWPDGSRNQTGKPVEVLLTPSELRTALASTAPFVSHDELRPAMTGVLVHLNENEKVKFVVTDGHRLYLYTIPTPEEKWNFSIGATYPIIPGAAASLLRSLLSDATEPVTLQLFANRAVVELPGWSWSCQLIDERYPDYTNVIPVSNPSKLLMDRLELSAALSRLTPYANVTTRQVRLKLSGSELVLSAQDLDFENEATERFAVQYDGEDMEIGFNINFLKPTLALLDSELVLFELSTPNRAGLISGVAADGKPGNLLALVMPVMLNNYV